LLFHDNLLNVKERMMKLSDSADFWPGLRTRGLRGVSLFMATFCSFATAVVFAFTIVLFVGVGAAMVSASKTGETAWRSETITVQARSESQTCTPSRQTACQPGPASLSARLVALLALSLVVGALPLLALAYGLLEASRCFGAMAKGRFLARQTVARLTRFAIGGLIFVLLSPHAGAITGATYEGLGKAFDLLTHAAPGGSYSSHFKFTVTGMSEWLNAIYALSLTVIAVVMARASSIAEDHAQIV
jgi:hypothetical protein